MQESVGTETYEHHHFPYYYPSIWRYITHLHTQSTLTHNQQTTINVPFAFDPLKLLFPRALLPLCRKKKVDCYIHLLAPSSHTYTHTPTPILPASRHLIYKDDVHPHIYDIQLIKPYLSPLLHYVIMIPCSLTINQSIISLILPLLGKSLWVFVYAWITII